MVTPTPTASPTTAATIGVCSAASARTKRSAGNSCRLSQRTPEILEIVAGGEIVAGARQHDGANLLVRVGLRERGDHRLVHGLVQRVPLGRPIDDDPHDGAVAAHDDLARSRMSVSFIFGAPPLVSIICRTTAAPSPATIESPPSTTARSSPSAATARLSAKKRAVTILSCVAGSAPAARCAASAAAPSRVDAARERRTAADRASRRRASPTPRGSTAADRKSVARSKASTAAAARCADIDEDGAHCSRPARLCRRACRRSPATRPRRWRGAACG